MQALLEEGVQPKDIKIKLLVGQLRDVNMAWVLESWKGLGKMKEGILAGYRKAGTGMC